MKDKFIIDRGTLIFSDNRIEIDDKTGAGWISTMVLPVVLMLNGIVYLWIYFQKGREEYHLWLGLFLILGVIIGRIIGGKKNFDKQILLNSIEKVILKKDLADRSVAVICSKERGRRMVVLDFDRYSLADFKQALEEKNIVMEIR